MRQMNASLNFATFCWRNWYLGSISSTCLGSAFTLTDPQSAKSCLTWLPFCLGSACVKAASKMLVKLTPGRQLTVKSDLNILSFHQSCCDDRRIKMKFHTLDFSVLFIFLTSFVTLSSTDVVFNKFNCNHNDDDDNDKEYDKNGINIYDDKVLSRQKRNFGGTEPINFQLVYNSVFGVNGWLASGIEILQDITFHLTGYTIIGKRWCINGVTHCWENFEPLPPSSRFLVLRL